WIDFCENHDSCACPKRKETTVTGGTKDISGFRLVDCKTEEDVKASVNQAFVALSYVWGAPCSGNAGESSPWSRVVKDAIEVTRQLGYRYLWVDRHCIDQENAQEKHQQIARMHDIYGRAQLTIIATAGDDASHGLFGVSRPRRQQPSISIDELHLPMVPSDPQASIRAFVWWHRGWTYQEGALSRSRIIF
ncbi:heterokaryon incompatibility protein-domain-containing protein, partial [Lasiosphaeris hirsuta]